MHCYFKTIINIITKLIQCGCLYKKICLPYVSVCVCCFFSYFPPKSKHKNKHQFVYFQYFFYNSQINTQHKNTLIFHNRQKNNKNINSNDTSIHQCVIQNCICFSCVLQFSSYFYIFAIHFKFKFIFCIFHR